MSITAIDYTTIDPASDTGIAVMAAVKLQIQQIEEEMAERLDMEYIAVPCTGELVDHVVGTVRTFRMPYAFTLIGLPRIAGHVAGTGADVIVDVNEGGVSILSTKLSMDAGETISTTATVPCVVSDVNLADFALITVDIDQIGSTIAGSGLTLYLYGRKTP